MRSLIRITYCLAIISFVLIQKLEAQSIYLSQYTAKNGLPSNNCYYTFQDRKGYIWIATDAGVSRFDGSVFENFTLADGLPDNQILQIHEDRKGRIWFLSLSGQLSYFFNGQIVNPSNNQQLKNINFNAIIVSFLEDRNGKIWFGTNKNLIGVWDGKQVQRFSTNNKQRQYINAYLTQTKDGQVWAYSTSGTFKFAGNKFIAMDDPIVGISYKGFYTNQDGSVYFLAESGLYRKYKSKNQLIFKIPKSVLSNTPGYIYVSKNDAWISNNNGIYEFKFDGSFTQTLKNIDVNQVIKDHDNNYWFTTNYGVYSLPEVSERLFIFNKDHGLSSNVIKSVTHDSRHRIWLGLAGGQINSLNIKYGIVDQFDITDKKNFLNIKQIEVDERNRKLYFAADYGLGVLPLANSNAKPQYLRENDNSFFVIKNFSLDSGKKIALSLSSGVAILNNRAKLEFSVQRLVPEQSFFPNRSYRVHFDNKQNLWFSNTSGLHEKLPDQCVKHFGDGNLLTKRINDIKQISGDTIALATDGFGILIYDKRNIIFNITTQNGLKDNIVTRLFVRNKQLWAITNDGVNKIKFHKKSYKVNGFDYTNDLLSTEINDLYIDRDTAYFATNNGLVYFNYNLADHAPRPLKIYISSIRDNKRPIDLSRQRFSLQPGEHNLVINFSAIDFKSRKITYRYRLKKDGNWTETNNRRLELSSLEAGSYEFEVSAKTSDRSWSKPAVVSFELQKHYWQKWWFITSIIVVAVALLLFGAVTFTKRQKNKEQEQLLLKNKILMLEQKALQAMMNPHFVFNVMNSIQHYINTQNTPSANKVLTGFAKLIRKNLDIVTKSYINIQEEIQYLNLYLSLEKYRFGDKLNYEIQIDEAIDQEDTFLPSMLLQPFIENAIWHGIMPKDAGGHITIVMQKLSEDYLLVAITDDGIGIDHARKQKNNGHQSKGMSLTTDRINLLNKVEPKPIQLSVRQNGDFGTIVQLHIPL